MGNRRKTAGRWSRRTAVLTLVACTVAAASADRITLRSGRVLEGAIVRQNANEVVLRTEVGSISLSRSDIQSIVSTSMEPEEVDGDTAYARQNYDAAARSYALALQKANQSAGGSEVRARLEKKIAQVQAAQQQRTSSAVAQQLQSARTLALAERWDEAEKALLTALASLAPESDSGRTARRLLAQVRYGLAEQALDRLDTLGQEHYLKRAIEADDSYYKAHLALGELLLRSAATSKQGLDEILKGLEYGGQALSEEESVKYHYLAGQKFYNKGDYAQAAPHLIQAIRGKGKYPAYSDADALAAKSYIKLTEANKGGDYRETIDRLNEALLLDPGNADARFLLGQIYLDQGDADKAIAELDETLRINASYPRAHRSLGRAFFVKKDYDKSLEHLDQELKNEPNSYEVLVDRASIYILLADYEKAKADVTAAIATEPSRWNAYLKAAEMASAQEQYDEARANLTKVLSLKPDAVEAYVEMGDILVKQKNYDDARKWYNEVIEYLGKIGGLSLEYRRLMADAQTQLGVIDLEQESPRQAETRFATALEHMPAHAMALNKVGDVKRRLGEEVKTRESRDAAAPLFGEAEQYYKRAIEADPAQADLYLSLAILYHQSMKEAEKALPNYMQYLAKGGSNAEVVKWVEEVGGNTTEAMALLARNASQGTETPDAGAPADTAPPLPPVPAPAAALAVSTTGTLTLPGDAATSGSAPAVAADQGSTTGTVAAEATAAPVVADGADPAPATSDSATTAPPAPPAAPVI